LQRLLEKAINAAENRVVRATAKAALFKIAQSQGDERRVLKL
jgi:hypothetical protein